MWSHYADGLRGFCLVFNEESIVSAEPEGYVTDVAYLEKPPLVDSFVYAVAYDQEDYHLMAIEETETEIRHLGKTDQEGWIPVYKESAEAALKHMREMWQHAFAAKPVEWRYERERRLLVYTERQDREAILRPYPKEALKEIVVGERMPPDYLARLIEILKEQFGDIPVRTARCSSDLYTLVIE
jgi:hypothetical protein